MKFIPGFFEKVQNYKTETFDASTFFHQEKILQFGSGLLFRFVSDLGNINSNNEGTFNGRVIVVKSALHRNRETLKSMPAVVSRILSAKEQWPDILTIACNPLLEIIISDKKITGKNILKDNIKSMPPFSFPGKLLAFLFQRFRHFSGACEKGLLIISAEQIDNNAEVLESIVLELAHRNNLEPSFLDWIENANHFCNKWP